MVETLINLSLLISSCMPEGDFFSKKKKKKKKKYLLRNEAIKRNKLPSTILLM